VPTAHVATIKSNHHGPNWRPHGLLHRFGDVLAHDVLAHPPRPVVRLRTVPAFCAPLIGSSSDSRTATLPNETYAAYRAVT
jgi:hypothetical protein